MQQANDIVFEWYLGEIGGRALFSTLAKAASPDEAAKWHMLAEVEAVMGARLWQALSARGAHPPEQVEADVRARAQARCQVIAGATWLQTMEWLRTLVIRALQRMQDQARELPPELAPIGDLIVRHEVALLAFAERELRKEGNDPLAPIRQFIAEC